MAEEQPLVAIALIAFNVSVTVDVKAWFRRGLAMTQSELAAHLGTTREVIARLIGKLVAERSVWKTGEDPLRSSARKNWLDLVSI